MFHGFFATAQRGAPRRRWAAALALAAGCAGTALAGSSNIAPGFVALPPGAKAVVMPVDVELFSLSAGGVAEPKADWTADAHKHMDAALKARFAKQRLALVPADDKLADEFAEQIGLHAAVARSINLHHGVGGNWKLPSKDGKLDWNFGDAMQSLQSRTGARYGLFFWVRDSYASAERKTAMVAVAILTLGRVAINGGTQTGYATLVDLQTGQVLWFNRLERRKGDLREEKAAAETIDELLDDFPEVR